MSARSQRGFTLLELLVVLVIMGMAAVLVVPQFQGLSQSVARDQAFAELNRAFLKGRMTAIRSGGVASLTLEEKKGVVTLMGDGHQVQLPEAARLRCGPKFRQASMQVRFFPNGSSSGLSCKLKLEANASEHWLRVSPVTGLVLLDA